MDMGNNSYYLGSSIATLLLVFIKILTIVLAIVVIIGVYVWIRDNLFKNSASRIVQDINKDPILKSVSVITVSIIGVVLVFALFSNLVHPRTGIGMMDHSGMNTFNPMLSISAVLIILIRVLMFIFTISLIMAAIMYFKYLYESGKLNSLFNSNQCNNQSNTRSSGIVVSAEEDINNENKK